MDDEVECKKFIFKALKSLKVKKSVRGEGFFQCCGRIMPHWRICVWGKRLIVMEFMFLWLWKGYEVRVTLLGCVGKCLFQTQVWYPEHRIRTQYSPNPFGSHGQLRQREKGQGQ